MALSCHQKRARLPRSARAWRLRPSLRWRPSRARAQGACWMREDLETPALAADPSASVAQATRRPLQPRGQRRPRGPREPRCPRGQRQQRAEEPRAAGVAGGLRAGGHGLQRPHLGAGAAQRHVGAGHLQRYGQREADGGRVRRRWPRRDQLRRIRASGEPDAECLAAGGEPRPHLVAHERAVFRPRRLRHFGPRKSGSGARARARHFLQLCLCELAVVCLRVRVSSWVLNRVLRWRLVTLAARPIVTGRFLTLLVRHRRISEALLVFLRLPGAERGVVPLLYFDAQLAELCRAPDVDQVVGRLVGRHGMGSFFRRFIVTAPPQMLRRFIQHKATAQLVAKVVCQFSAARDSAAWAHRRRRELPAAVARACQEPGAELWAMHFCATPGVEEWLGALLSDPRGAGFAHRLLLEPGFIDKVEDFLGFKEARKFVIRLLRQPGVYRFVTWLNRDPEMQRWFARIAKREKPMVFITEMLQEPGLDKFIVGLLLRKGNDTALRSMLDFWVHTEGSFASVFGSFSKKPGVERALARVVISPGFLDGFVFRKFLWQDGLWELAVEAATLVGVRGLVDNVLPLTLAVLSAILAFYAQGDACPR
ncbi:unnamed protein product [Effrenium voratum]|uniref:Uncharacterized protein n=1 Tax=Effrenium voratum TaxID=2562239 RepID=A0AA36MNJ4_9DINO|nr:unnamed protein product [Effrenium voratum]